MGGMLEVEMFAAPRGMVRMTWLGGMAAPVFSAAYIKSMLCRTYGCSGTKCDANPASQSIRKWLWSYWKTLRRVRRGS